MNNSSSDEERQYFLFFCAYIAVAGGYSSHEKKQIRNIGLQIGASDALIEETLDIFVYSYKAGEKVEEISEGDKADERIDALIDKAVAYFRQKANMAKRSEELATKNKSFNKKLYQSLIRVAKADGDFDDDEWNRVNQIADVLMLSEEERKQYRGEILKQIAQEKQQEIADAKKASSPLNVLKSLFSK